MKWSTAFLIAIGITLAAMAFGGCATGTYATCEERAAKHGTVLECNETLVYQDGQRVTRCLVSTPQGDRFHFYKSCGPESAKPLETWTPAPRELPERQ